LENGQFAAPPKGPLILYCGGHPHGWSWTDNRETAQWFADRTPPIQDHPYVYRAVVDSKLLYARIHEPGLGRSEYEYVVPGHLLEAVREPS
jgi:hypothetical protein